MLLCVFVYINMFAAPGDEYSNILSPSSGSQPLVQDPLTGPRTPLRGPALRLRFLCGCIQKS